MNRREALKMSAMAGVAAAAGLQPGTAAALPELEGLVRKRGRIRNIIFLVYDGTGYEDFASADFFARRVVGRPLRYREFLSGGRAGTMIPSSLTSWVTDSSAAATTWATGRKIINGAVSIYPDGRELTTIMTLARETGRATGLVTTARATHATPAAWVASIASRDSENEIADQYLASGTDVILGGGAAHFDPARRSDGRDLFAAFAEKGYEVVRTKEELAAATGSKLLGTFAPGTRHVAYEIDRRFQPTEVDAPSLADMTKVALDRLDGAERGFVLQVEAGRIDHGNHQNDPGAALWDWIAADDALSLLLDFIRDRDDTLLIHCPDHDTGGGVTYGWGGGYGRTDPSLLTLGARRASHEYMLRELMPANPSATEVREVIEMNLGVPVDDVAAERIAALIAGEDMQGLRWGHLNAHGGGRTIQISQIVSLSPMNQPDRPAISFATQNHTAGFVPVVVAGGGIEPGNLGVVDNTSLFGVMLDALGIEFENPMMTAEEALRIVNSG